MDTHNGVPMIVVVHIYSFLCSNNMCVLLQWQGTAFTVEFGTQTTPGLKNKGGEKTTKQLGEAEGKESIFRQPRSSSEPSKGRRKIPQSVFIAFELF